jgi:hypothetical protein
VTPGHTFCSFFAEFTFWRETATEKEMIGFETVFGGSG